MLQDIEETQNRIIQTKWIFTDNVTMDQTIIQTFYQMNYNIKPDIIQV